jgi:hypothetical protein
MIFFIRKRLVLLMALSVGLYVLCVVLLITLKRTTSYAGSISFKEILVGPIITMVTVFSLCGIGSWLSCRKSTKDDPELRL